MSAAYSDREKRLALITGAVLGLGLLWTTGIGPAITQYRELSGDLRDAGDAVEKAERQRRRNKRYQRRRSDIRKLLNASDGDAFIKKLEKAVEGKKLVIKAQSPSGGERRPKAGYEVKRFTMRIEADNVREVSELLRVLQEDEGLLRARSVSFSQNRRGIFMINLTVSTLAPLSEKQGS